MTQKLIVRSLPLAYQIIKEMNYPQEWDGEYRSAALSALVQILEECMHARIDHYLKESGRSLSDRRNASFSQYLLTELGDIEIHVPRMEEK